MRVGLLTYHHAYNFGSVLQAYATQEAIRALGHDVKIIDYRIPFQKKYYSLLGYGVGLKGIILKASIIPSVPARIKRKRLFESFINTFMDTTEELISPDCLYKLNDHFDVFLSGSDQVWNIHSNEFIESGHEYMLPYLLHFTEKKKVSYASSIASSSRDEVRLIIDYLRDFDNLSFRERDGAELVSELLGRNVVSVLDPTFLLGKEAWQTMASLGERRSCNAPFWLCYTLKGAKLALSDLFKIARIARSKGARVIAIAPLAPSVPINGVTYVSDIGPLEFLRLVRDASRVCADSYHGTIFSIIFEKDFIYIRHEEESADCRARDMLGKLGLLERMKDASTDFNCLKPIDYSNVKQLERAEADQSWTYIKKALRNC